MKKVMCFVLIILFILPVMCSCKNNEKSSAETPSQSEQSQEETTAAENSRLSVSDDLPEADYNGRQFNFLCRTSQLYEYNVESENGEIVNDALYNRNKAVEDRFNVKINTVDMDGSWGNMANYKNIIKNSVLAGDGTYDLVEGDTVIADLLGNGYFVNLLDSQHINVDKPWWAKASVNVLDVGGVLEFISGDYSLLLWEGLCVVYFNKKLIADYGLESPYELVKSGRWTLDTIEQLSKNIYKDLNGDGKAGLEDLYGLVFNNDNLIDNFLISCEVKLTANDEDGFPMFTDPTDDRSVAVVQKVFDIIHKPEVYSNESQPRLSKDAIFTEDRSLLYMAFLRSAQSFRNMDTDFGILPYPKYDEAQKDYKTFSKAGFAAFAIPGTVKDRDFSEIMLEALCAESYKKVIPAYYDIALKNKYARDDDSSEMLDIIREGFDYDFSCIALDYTDWVLTELRGMASGKTFDWVSRMEKKKNKIDKNLENLKEQIIKNRK